MPVADVVELADTVAERSLHSFETTDREEGRAFLSEMRAETSGLRTDRDGPFSVRVHRLMIGHLSVSRLRFASSVAASAPPMDNDYLIPLPVTGRSMISSGGRELLAGPGMTCLIGSHQDVLGQMGMDYDYVNLNIPNLRLESLAAQIAGGSRSGRIRLPMVRQNVPAGWMRLLTAALQLPLAGGTGEIGDRLEAVLLESLLLAGAGPLGLEPPAERVRARTVLRRAQEYMMADPGRPPALTSVAAHCGVSVRTIQIVFRTVLNTTPTAWMRSGRLRKARAMLLVRQPGFVTVTDVAIAHGFVHMGDFAAQFRSEFGVTPSRVTTA
jgi:AraC-like DNA-binding protein